MKKTILLVAALITTGAFYMFGRGIWFPMYTKVIGKKTVGEVIEEYGPAAESKLRKDFISAGAPFPPLQLALLAIKEDKVLELWSEAGTGWRFVKQYKVLAASGVAGPKLREGDRQVPEGVYKIVGLNPNSSYHLSIKIDYPNEFDLARAKKEGRTNPGSDIFIHGKNASIGCLAIGDSAIEELFYLVHKIGKENSTVVIAPQDPRVKTLIPPEGSPAWVNDLYSNINLEFMRIAKT
jgi:L,D-peptidoglycan transpeptidase YkuD (ErfK/YbiS/YcfS/YnhG family)